MINGLGDVVTDIGSSASTVGVTATNPSSCVIYHLKEVDSLGYQSKVYLYNILLISGGETESHTFFSGRTQTVLCKHVPIKAMQHSTQKVSDIEMYTFNVIRFQMFILSKS